MTPKQIKTLYAKAVAAQSAGRLGEAEKAYTRILKANPRVAEAHFNLGRIGAARGQIAGAAQHFEAALALKPGQPEIWFAYLDMASHHPNTRNLDKLLKRGGPELERFAQVLFFKGLVAARSGRAKEAFALFEAAISKGLRLPRAHVERGILQAEAGDSDAALADFDAALALNAKDDFALERKAELLRDLGQSDAARAVAKDAIAAAPGRGIHYYTYASIKKMQADDPMIAQMQQVFAKMKPADAGLAYLGHALAKAMEDTGAFEKVFGYLDAANGQLSKTFPYHHKADQEATQLNNARHASLVASGLEEAKMPAGPVPIFVTGMPRSGTTLIEQILSSHSDCAGGGELSILGGLIRQAVAEAGEDMTALSAGLKAAAQRYVAELAERFPGARYVTDKSISSYAMIGFIRHALPQAPIIVVRRDPADNALSLYKNLFTPGTHRYATDLADIARFMRLFEAQIAHWEEVLPGACTTLHYEKLIVEPEAQSRALVAAAGLDWQEACLSFYDNDRTVNTLSSAQVRQPIYSSSVGAWQRHEAEMARFLEAYAAG